MLFTACKPTGKNTAAKYIPDNAMAVVVVDPVQMDAASDKSSDLYKESREKVKEQLAAVKLISVDAYDLLLSVVENPNNTGFDFKCRMFGYILNDPNASSPEDFIAALVLPMDKKENWENVLTTIGNIAQSPLPVKQDGDLSSIDLDDKSVALGWNGEVLVLVAATSNKTNAYNCLKALSQPAKTDITSVPEFKDFLDRSQIMSGWISMEKCMELADMTKDDLAMFYSVYGEDAFETSTAEAHLSINPKGKIDLLFSFQFYKAIENINKLGYDELMRRTQNLIMHYQNIDNSANTTDYSSIYDDYDFDEE